MRASTCWRSLLLLHCCTALDTATRSSQQRQQPVTSPVAAYFARNMGGVSCAAATTPSKQSCMFHNVCILGVGSDALTLVRLGGRTARAPAGADSLLLQLVSATLEGVVASVSVFTGGGGSDSSPAQVAQANQQQQQQLAAQLWNAGAEPVGSAAALQQQPLRHGRRGHSLPELLPDSILDEHQLSVLWKPGPHQVSSSH
jgi:hypothetical protein